MTQSTSCSQDQVRGRFTTTVKCSRISSGLRPAHALLCAALLLSGCGAGRVIQGLGQMMTTDAELAQGAAARHEEIVKETPRYDHKGLADYVNRVGRRVAAAAAAKNPAQAGIAYKISVLDDPEPNAFAIPGGYLYINRGLLTLLRSEDELAAVIGHEIAHVTAGHAAKRARARGGANVLAGAGRIGLSLASMANPLLLLGNVYGGDAAAETLSSALSSTYSRQNEFEADGIGMESAAAAGYASDGAIRAQRALQAESNWSASLAIQQGFKPQAAHGIFDSHPDNQARVQKLAERAAQLKVTRKPPVADYLARLQGVRYGLRERLGVQRGQWFYNGAHGWRMKVPERWFVGQSEEDQAITLAAPKSAATMIWSRREVSEEMSPAAFVKTYVGGVELKGATRNFGDRPMWRGAAKSKGQTIEVLGWTQVSAGGETPHGFLLMGQLVEKAAGVKWPAAFDAVCAELRPQRADEAPLARSPTLRIETADGKKKYADLARNSPFGRTAEAQLRVINGQFPGGEPAKGQRLKIIQ